MSDSPSIRPVVLIVTSLLTFLVGVFIGTRLSGGGPAMAEGSGEQAVSAADARERDAGSAMEASRAAGLEPSAEVEAAVAAGALSPESAELDAFLKFSQMDALGAAQEALAETNDLEKMSKLALLLSTASSEDMPEIAALIRDNRNDYERMQQMGMLYYAWGRVDAPSAVAFAEAQGGRHSGMATSVALSSWASLDPANARAWVEGQEDPSQYQRGLLIGWSENNPMQALQYLSQQDGNADLMNRWTAPQVARNLVAARGVMALDDLAAMPANRNREALLDRLADELGETQPAAAAARLANIDDPEILRTAVPEVAEEWAQNDPQAAIDFVSEYKDNPELYARAMADVIEEWAERDPYEAGKYLNEQPASPELDRSVAEYSREVADVDPVGAMSFAVSVNDDRLRADTIRRVARDWQRRDKEAYQAWAEANPEFAPENSGD